MRTTILILLFAINIEADVNEVAQSFEFYGPATGVSLETGSFSFFKAEDCANLPSCYGNNPTSPYGIPKLPYGDNPNSSHFQLKRDQAVVMIMKTPPKSTYIGFTHYVYDRFYLKGGRKTVFASMGDTINNLTIRCSALDPFEELAAFVMVASFESLYKVSLALQLSGIRAENINVLVIPYTQVSMGNSIYSDTFRILTRIAKPSDRGAFDEYIANPPVAVYRASSVNSTFTAIAPPAIRPKGTGTTESQLTDTLTALEQAVVQHYSNFSPRQLPVAVNTTTAEECLQSGKNCNGDNRDALYETVTVGLLQPSKPDFVVVYGVNHTNTNKASYSNFSMYDVSRLAGVSSVTDDEFSQSGKYFLGESYPNADKVFAYKVARSCGVELYCVEIPSEGELSIPGDKPIAIVFRTYLEAITKTGPLASELLRPKAIRFSPLQSLR